MKKVLAGVLITLAAILIYNSFKDYGNDGAILKENSMLIQKQIANVSKLIVTEGHFAEVYNYADSKELFGPLLTADKKALVVVNAEVIIAYDLKEVNFEIDETTKSVHISHLPEAEIKINPDFEYYDITADYLNPFEANDYNTIKRNVKTALLKKVKASGLLSNAKNRFITELSQVLVLTNSMGWTLRYQPKPIKDVDALNLLR